MNKRIIAITLVAIIATVITSCQPRPKDQHTHDGWWPDVEAMYATINADMFKGSPIQKQYDSLGNDPAHFPDLYQVPRI